MGKMRKAIVAAFLCGVLAGLPIVAQADTVEVSANIVNPEVNMTVNPTSLDFGTLLPGQISPTQTINVSNHSTTTPINVDVSLIDYPPNFGDPKNDPTKVGLFWTFQPWSPSLFQVGSEGSNPAISVETDRMRSIDIFVKVGTNPPTGPVNFTLEFRPSPYVP